MKHSGVDRRYGQAVVAGGGIAGLLAARVLSDHFERVVLIDRDHLCTGADLRPGVPQGRHGHSLLMRGLLIMSRLFPGLEDELVAAGATQIRTEDVAWNHGGGWRAMPISSRRTLSLSRPLLESTIVRRLKCVSNISFMEGFRAIEPTLGPSGSVAGVSVRQIEHGQSISEVPADLLVDAAAPRSVTSDWLTARGFASPRYERLVSPVTYVSGLFERRDEDQPWQVLLVSGAPRTRTGAALPIEGGRWLVSLGAVFDEPAPRNLVDFVAFAERLDVPDLHRMLVGARPLADVSRMRFPYSERLRYENLASPPPGLIAIGDAVCRFSPLLGQGMTVAAIEAEVLQRLLASHSEPEPTDAGFPRRWYTAITPTIDHAWMAVVAEHYRYAQCARDRPWHLIPVGWYLRRLEKASHRDAAVTDVLLDVMSFLSRPSALFSPMAMARVLRASL